MRTRVLSGDDLFGDLDLERFGVECVAGFGEEVVYREEPVPLDAIRQVELDIKYCPQCGEELSQESADEFRCHRCRKTWLFVEVVE